MGNAGQANCVSLRAAMYIGMACVGAALLHGGPAAAAKPFTYIYDAPAEAAAALTEKTLAKKSNWVRVKENDTTYRFKGCAVFMNDKIVAVLGKNTASVDLYSKLSGDAVQGPGATMTPGRSGPAGREDDSRTPVRRPPITLKLCARLQPVHSDGTALKPRDFDPWVWTVKKNTTGSVSIEVALQSPGAKPCHVTYTLNVGEPFIKTTATAGVARLRVRAPCRFAVMPDFFGDDIVVDAEAIGKNWERSPVLPGQPPSQATRGQPTKQGSVPSSFQLPSENFLLHMMHGGDAILMTVSQSRGNDVSIVLSKSAPRRIVSSDISYGKKPGDSDPWVCVAILADKGIWHEHTVRLTNAGDFIKLDWKMPFTALWRVDWSTADKLTDSWQMLLQDPKGKYVMQGWFGQDASSGQRFGREFGPRDWNKPRRKRWNPVLGSFSYPCWIDNDRQGYFQPLTKRRYVERGEVCNFDGPAIIYPIDRVKVAPFSTPIEKLTVVDLVRMTLGVGPCKYILDLEGQKRNSKGVATCYARDVITAIYKEGSQLQKGPVIEEHLAQAVAFIRNVRERIDDYVKFGHETRAYLERQKRLHPKHAKFLDELLSITKRLDQFFQSRKAGIYSPQYAERAAGDFRKELLKYNGPDAYAKCSARMKVFTGIGGKQDGLVASCRMIVKILRQRCGIALAMNPELKEIATEIRVRTQKILRNPTGYEAPQH